MVVFVGHYAKSLAHYLPDGGTGVQVFFVISGFLITGILLSTLEKSRNANQSLLITIRQFFIRRVLRIFPPYFAALFVAFSLNQGDWHLYWAWLVLFAGNWYMAINNSGMGGYSPYWSVAVEEQFYLFWPFVVFFIPFRFLVGVCWTLIAGSLLFKAIGLLVGLPHLWLYVATFSSFDALGLGAILAVYRYTNQTQKFDRLCKLCFCFGVPLFLLTYVIRVLGYKSIVNTQLSYAAAVAVGVWLVGKAAQDSKWIFQKVLDNRVVRYLGQISYGLYLYHMLVYVFGIRLYAYLEIPWDQNEVARVLILTVASFAVTIASYHFLELPIMRMKKNHPYILVNREPQ